MLFVETPAQAESDETSSEVTVLPPFDVRESSAHLGFALRAWFTDDAHIEVMKFTRVDRRSLASKAGLKRGDRLLAIDGQSVVGGTLAEFKRLFVKDLVPHETVTWIFTVERGIFRREKHELTLRMRVSGPLDPL